MTNIIRIGGILNAVLTYKADVRIEAFNTNEPEKTAPKLPAAEVVH